MITTTSPAALIPVAPVFTNTERLALAGFLAGYSGLTREAYKLDLRQYASWCHRITCACSRPSAVSGRSGLLGSSAAGGLGGAVHAAGRGGVALSGG